MALPGSNPGGTAVPIYLVIYCLPGAGALSMGRRWAAPRQSPGRLVPRTGQTLVQGTASTSAPPRAERGDPLGRPQGPPAPRCPPGAATQL